MENEKHTTHLSRVGTIAVVAAIAAAATLTVTTGSLAMGIQNARVAAATAEAVAVIDGRTFDAAQVDNARTIIGAAKTIHPADGFYAAQVGIMAALVQSDLYNTASAGVLFSQGYPHDNVASGGDRVGLFQLPEDSDWRGQYGAQVRVGQVENLMSPQYVAGRFMTELHLVDGWENMGRADAAHTVLNDADVRALEAVEGVAKNLTLALFDTTAAAELSAGVHNPNATAETWVTPIRGVFPVARPYNTEAGSLAFKVGLDVPAGTEVFAPASGEVVESRAQATADGKPEAYRVVIRHTDNTWSVFVALGGTTVTVGDQVAAGQLIGTVGEYPLRVGAYEFGHQVVDPIGFYAQRGVDFFEAAP